MQTMTHSTKPFPQPALMLERRRPTLDDVPQDELLHRSVCLYLIGALVWDYTDTVLKLVAQMRVDSLKRLSRSVRELRLDYDRVRSQDLDTAYIRREWELAEMFEDVNKDTFDSLCNGLLIEIRRDTALDDDNVILVEAVQIAMTMLDALRLYADRCDRFIRRYYPTASHSILPDHFRRLAILLPEYAGDCYDRYSNSRQLTARILLNRINEIKPFDEQ